MRVTKLKKSTKVLTAYVLMTYALLLGLSGCFLIHMGEFLATEAPRRDYRDVVKSYKETILKESNASEVLPMIYYEDCNCEVLSQTKSIVASQGQNKRKHKTWFNMVTFDENALTARRKYICLVDERPKVLFIDPWQALRFNCEMVFDREVLDEPYANENAMRIAILKQVLEHTREDMRDIGPVNKKIKVLGMMINQAMETILVKLDTSPALAANINDPKGIEFDHINMDRGRVQMTIEDDIVTTKIRLGQYVTKLKWSEKLDDY